MSGTVILSSTTTTDHSHVSADSHVAVIAPRRRKLAGKVSGHGMLFPPQIWIKHGSLSKPRFLVRRQSICLSESSGRVLLVLATPVSRDLATIDTRFRTSYTFTISSKEMAILSV
jgi:hypothetical protein